MLTAVFMRDLIIWIIIGGLSLITFLFFIIKSLIKKSKKNIFISFGFLCLTLCIGTWVVYNFAIKSYNKIAKTFKPRSGIEIYSALFGKPEDNCVKVLNKTDQVVPRLDCCVWLEFTTCPTELNRVISQYNYKLTEYSSSDTSNYIPDYSPKPFWWTPYNLGDSVIVMRDFNFDNPNRDKILIFSKDSSRAFYCDMAD